MKAGANCSTDRIGGWPPRFDNVQISRRWGRGGSCRSQRSDQMTLRNPALVRAKRTRDWLCIELEHFEQQLERGNTKGAETHCLDPRTTCRSAAQGEATRTKC